MLINVHILVNELYNFKISELHSSSFIMLFIIILNIVKMNKNVLFTNISHKGETSTLCLYY